MNAVEKSKRLKLYRHLAKQYLIQKETFSCDNKNNLTAICFHLHHYLFTNGYRNSKSDYYFSTDDYNGFFPEFDLMIQDVHECFDIYTERATCMLLCIEMLKTENL